MCYLEGNDFSEKYMVSVLNHYVYQTLQSVIGKHVVIETVRGNIRGKLKGVKPDHLLIEDTVPYIVRIQQIVWIMPKQ
ncbi:YuzF family protein [Bacillus thuringiensis]|nr:YuzF family protein [Bacillus thuringiensis]